MKEAEGPTLVGPVGVVKCPSSVVEWCPWCFLDEPWCFLVEEVEVEAWGVVVAREVVNESVVEWERVCDLEPWCPLVVEVEWSPEVVEVAWWDLECDMEGPTLMGPGEWKTRLASFTHDPPGERKKP